MDNTPPPLRITTFSYAANGGVAPKVGPEAVIIDCRKFDNVWRDPALRSLPGDDPRILEYMMKRNPGLVAARLAQATKAVEEEGKTHVLFGCEHGKHRSVAMATAFKGAVAK